MEDRKTITLAFDVMCGDAHPNVPITHYNEDGRDCEDMCYYPEDQVLGARDGKLLILEYFQSAKLWLVWVER